MKEKFGLKPKKDPLQLRDSVFTRNIFELFEYELGKDWSFLFKMIQNKVVWFLFGVKTVGEWSVDSDPFPLLCRICTVSTSSVPCK